MPIPCTPHKATPEEIGRLRKQLRYESKRTDGLIDGSFMMKVQSLDDSSFMWLRQRLRPSELALLDNISPRHPYVIRNGG